MSLQGKNVLVGMGGGIAAFKAVGVVRELQRQGAHVKVMMTESATRFVGPMTLAGITGDSPATDLWDASYAGEVHVELAAWADIMVIAPATMNLMARAAGGQANDVVLATLACRKSPVVFAPAMHTQMWSSPATQRNVALLEGDGVLFAGPVSGPLASGEEGHGRMAEPEDIVARVAGAMAPRDFAGRRVLITAGPTLEDLDPVRFLGNRSTGKMGYALARAAAMRGAEVVLVSGPTNLATPADCRRVDVRSAREMQAAVTDEEADLIFMAAAVADYRPASQAEQKIKKGDGPATVELVRNPDILLELGTSRSGRRPVLVGFALETQNVIENARSKLLRKKVDLIVANHASDAFGKDTNVATLVGADDEIALGELGKDALAHRIMDRAQLFFRRS